MSTLFISHGAPSLVLEPGKTGDLLAALGQSLPRPEAILAVSAHWDTQQPRISTAPHPETIHDFGGFPPAMYEMQYPAQGAPELAQGVAEKLALHNIPVNIDPIRGLDHGAWVPLMLMYPDADIPVTQLSIQSHAGPRAHYALGQVLAGLQSQKVMLMCSGAITHNLHDFFTADRHAKSLHYVQAFSDWMAEKIAENDIESLLNYRKLAPGGIRAHPHEDHLMPLFVALGAAAGKHSTRHQPETTYGFLAMDAYLWP